MSEIVNQSLQKIAKGTGIIFIGTIIGMLLGFVSRVFVVRYITQSEYGIFSLALVLTSIFATISTLGLQQGSTRYIAYFRGKKEEGKVRGVISSSIKIALIASIIFSLILFLLADFISTIISHSSELSIPLKIFSFTIPFTVLMGIFTSLFQGFNRVEPNVYFQIILSSVIYITFLAGAVLLGLSFLGVLYAYLASIVITCITFAIYTIKKLPLPTFPVKTKTNANAATAINPIGKELLFFSIPLLVSSILGTFMHQLDTLMLGYFKTSDIVGLYNGALPLASSILPLPLYAVGFIYIPIVSKLYSQKSFEEMKQIYVVLTKWIFSATLPLFLILFLFPKIVLNFLFGPDYIQAGVALQLLSLGFIIHAFLGSNGNTLLVMGKTRFIMAASVVCVILNLILNLMLIPPFGIMGAAIATASSLGIINILLSTELYRSSGIHPFTKNYLKPIIASGILISLIYGLSKIFFTISFWHLPILFVIFIFVYGLSLLLTKSFDKEDIQMLLIIEKRTGIDAAPIKRLLKRFV
jgi:O-antigen/teichoic acid export membrane protein